MYLNNQVVRSSIRYYEHLFNSSRKSQITILIKNNEISWHENNHLFSAATHIE